LIKNGQIVLNLIISLVYELILNHLRILLNVEGVDGSNVMDRSRYFQINRTRAL
jgi:hypothetical protein